MTVSGHKALVVDDSQATAQALAELLRAEGLEVSIAGDGAEAVKRATTEEVDIVLLDVELPGMDGLQALRMLRSTQSQRYLPVLMLSVREDRQKRLTALRLGADDFIQKPWDSEELIARVRRCLQVRARFDDLAVETEELHRLAVTDGLTQVHNHRFFQDRLRDEFRRAQRYDDPVSLILLDIDLFKVVNDKFGHQEGDRVLKLVAECLRKSVRDTDVLARYGGEEFAVLLPKTHLAGALTVAERVWKDVSTVRAGPSAAAKVTASLGVSGYPNRSVVSADQLFRTADDALYRAKREGRNKICLFQQTSLFTAQAS
jgi:two-component system cell cycle response regulator